MPVKYRITQPDCDSAIRGLGMLGMTPSELDKLAQEHEGREMFASHVIVAAAKQIAAEKRKVGHDE